jgi:hypothetical protein
VLGDASLTSVTPSPQQVAALAQNEAMLLRELREDEKQLKVRERERVCLIFFVRSSIVLFQLWCSC